MNVTPRRPCYQAAYHTGFSTIEDVVAVVPRVLSFSANKLLELTIVRKDADPVIVGTGNYVITAPDGAVSVMDEEAFATLYEPLDPTAADTP